MTHRAGFTLLEVLISMAIATMLLYVITQFTLDVGNISTSYNKSATELEESNLTFTVLRSELLSATQSVQGAYPVISASPTQISFYSDTDGDGIPEQVRYFLNGTTMQKGVIHATGNPLFYDPGTESVSDVIHFIVPPGATPLFSYYDNTFTGSQDPLSYPIDVSTVRMIKVTVTVDENAETEPGPVTTTGYATIRNLRTSP